MTEAPVSGRRYIAERGGSLVGTWDGHVRTILCG